MWRLAFKARMSARWAVLAMGLALAPGGLAQQPRAAAEAGRAFEAFTSAHREVLALSRRNTNVRSLALSLNDQGRLAAECDELLATLAKALDARRDYGTR